MGQAGASRALFGLGLLAWAACSGEGSRAADAGSGVPAREAPLAVADAYGCVVRNGEARCWGRHPRFAGSLAPERFPELDDAVELAAGASILCGRRADGTVHCSTRPFFPTDSPSTVEIAAVRGLDEVRVLAAGDRHACALRANGDVQCWGKNDLGQLGDRALGDRGTPPAAPIVRGASALSARGDTTCAVVGGRVHCWGRALGGQSASRPAPVARIESAIAVAVGVRHACALDALGRVGCWGAAAGEALVPPRPDAVYVEIAAGRDVTCGRRRGAGGAIECWGANATRRPVSGARHLALGPDHGCVERVRDVACWGQNDDGQVLGSLSRDRPPSRVVGLEDAIDVRTHAGGRCALRRDGSVVCWGRLDPIPWDDSVEPATPPRWRVARTPQTRAGITGATAIATAWEHGCALVAEGRLRCWGSNEAGQLGIPGATIVREAREVPGVTGARAVCADLASTTYLDATGAVRCVGECGEGGWRSAEWTTIAGVAGAVEIGCGPTIDCARSERGEVWCWGDDLRTDRRMLPGRDDRPVPARPPRAWLATSGATRLWVGDTHACARRADRSLVCWGYGDTGQLGVAACGGDDERCVLTREPVVFPGAETAEDVWLARGTCLRRAGGPISCTGARDSHYEGFSLDAATVPGSEDAAGWTPGCVLARNGHVTCWGANAEGEVGDGISERLDDARPVPGL